MDGALGLCLVGNARADESEYRRNLNVRSLQSVLDDRAVPLLEAVSPKEGRAGVQRDVLAELARSPERRVKVDEIGQTRESRNGSFVRGKDESWYFEVLGDGSRFRYCGNIDDPKERDATAKLPKLDNATLEKLGAGFIHGTLGSVLAISRDDRMVFLGSRYLREGDAEVPAEGAAAPKLTSLTREVVANIAVFGPEVRGTYVAGPGSKVAVWLSNAGEVVGFDVDWPSYRVLETRQPTLGRDDTWQRFARYADAAQKQIEGNLQRFECGYIDLSGRKRGAAPLQAGCAAQHAGFLQDDLEYASIELIPVGKEIVADPSWPVTRAILAGVPLSDCDRSRQSCSELPSVRE